ncbi:peptidylglycine alpha-hydroxylating monooxygenase isoform X2 [Venturia canescens]|uniref:peptidylglycine alpha-hydroxylating monooxygenase isoform X2 n=1 Tax=Venturia canescens TaxID=32260 RepID=UPI001C9BD569|nr:peptidylglycine alpha-hydroxylating monooxygenase isoform X2 [Venturia canescens]
MIRINGIASRLGTQGSWKFLCIPGSDPELYLCTPVKVDVTKSYYIVGFQPNATSDTAHHMLLYGCKEPGSAKSVWNCGEMTHATGSEDDSASPCADGSEILYAWARDAPDLNLPDGVGFKVGRATHIKYLVLQVHYAHIDRFKDGSTDDSGVILHYTLQPLKKMASVILLGTAGIIPPQSTEYMETACTLKENKTIHPFAYRTHTHALGKVVSGYLVKPNGRWIELGKRNPLTPQMFYPVHNNITAELGDTFAARCTMESNRKTWTRIGTTNSDEMCNFYLMVYVENDEPPHMKYCFTNGPPTYSWQLDGLPNIPFRDASTLEL